MKEIPIPYVRANQICIVLFVLAALLLEQPGLILALWLIQLTGLLIGIKGNLFILLTRPILRSRVMNAPTESAELQRFNNSIAVVLLTCSVVAFLLGYPITGYIFASIVALAAFAAICGYCIGCILYYQFKQWKHRTRQG